MDKNIKDMERALNAVFDQADQTFKSVDKLFKTLEQHMDEVMTSPESKGEWETWFAWYPVKDLHGKKHWFKKVYRRYSWAKSTEQPFGKGYDYGTIFDVLKDTK